MDHTPAYLVNAACHMATLERNPRTNKAVLTCRLRELNHAREDLRAHPKLPEDFECLINTKIAMAVHELRAIQKKMAFRKQADLTVIEHAATKMVEEL